MIMTASRQHRHQWPAYTPHSTAQWVDQLAEDSRQDEEPPRLSVEIAHPWSEAQSKRRSMSDRLHTPISTKAVAAAVCTQNTRRRRFRSEGSGVETPRAGRDDSDINAASTISTPYGNVGESSPPSQSETVRRFLNKRRHERSCSAPERPANSLHVNTVLPLNLPPLAQCAAAAASTSSMIAPLRLSDARRSESLGSYVSSGSDGSWHGDDGDQDPDAQLARAINEMQIQDKRGRMAEKLEGSTSTHAAKPDRCIHGHGPLQVSTYDYIDDLEDDDDLHALPSPIEYSDLPTTPTVIKQLEQYRLEMMRIRSEGLSKFGNDDDIHGQEELISKHAGPLVAALADKLFGVGPSITAMSESHHHLRPDSMPSLDYSSASSSSTASCPSPTIDERAEENARQTHRASAAQPSWWRSFASV